MKILIIGGAGYIGSALVPALMERGYEIDVLDLFWFGNYLPPAVRIIKKDVFACTKADFAGYDQIVLLAGLSNDPMAEFNPAMNFTFNGSLPSYAAYVAKLAGVRRVVYASSCSVYGYTVNELYDEDAPVTCNYPYGISKLQGERGVLQMRDKDFSVIALRKGTVCGYSPRMRFDLIINTMYKCAVLDGRITVNNASLWRPILDIRDAVSAYLRAIQADYSVSGIFNIASDNCTVGYVADRVKDTMEGLLGKPVAVDIKHVQDLRNYKVSIARAKTVLGFEPAYRVDDIVKDVHNHRDQYPKPDEDKYYNIRVFKKMAPTS